MLLNKTKIKVSIVLAAYNGEKYISNQIDSILKQSYPYWELIICEDHSSDSTLKIAKSYANKDTRIKIIQNRINLGVSRNIENGLKFCRGKYITLSDQDDFWMNNKLEKQIQYLDTHKNIGLVYHDLYIVNEELSIIGDSFLKKQKGGFYTIHNINVQDDTLNTLIRENHITGATIMFRHNLTKLITPIPEKALHDYWIVLIATTFSKIGYIDKRLVKYRQHPDNLIGATVRGYKFYLSNIFKKEYKTLYQKECKRHLIALNRLFYLASNLPEEEKLILATITCLKSLLRLINSNNMTSLLKEVIDSIVTIYKFKQYYHYNFLPYLVIYKISILRR